MVIQITGLTGDALTAANAAAGIWASLFSSPVNITVNMAMGTSAGLADAQTPLESVGYSTVAAALAAQSGQPGKSILADLPDALNTTNVSLPSGDSLTGFMNLTEANAQALGLTDVISQNATVTFSTGYTWYYGLDGNVPAGAFDFESVALHELGHVLGFISSEDDVDTGATSISPTPLDLFRFTATCVQTSADPFETCPRDLTPSSSIVQVLSDGTVSYPVCTGAKTGDGCQASHYQEGVGVMQYALAPGTAPGVSSADIWAMEMIGYDSAVPEPATLAFVALGLAGLAALARRRRSA